MYSTAGCHRPISITVYVSTQIGCFKYCRPAGLCQDSRCPYPHLDMATNGCFPLPLLLTLIFGVAVFTHSTKAALFSQFRAERQSAWMSKITNDGLTWSGTGCFVAVPIWQQWRQRVNELQLHLVTITDTPVLYMLQ